MYTVDELRAIIKEELDKKEYIQEPYSLFEPILYILEDGGKRLRPLLTLMAYNLYREDIEKVLKSAIGIEIFHNYTLLHDDVMDDAELRRGRPTVHKKWNSNVAILSGDAAAITAYQCIEHCEDKYLRRAIDFFNQVAMDVCRGQQYDMLFETRNDVSEEEYIKMIYLKTSVLLAGSLRHGALLADAPEHEYNALYEFGGYLGLAFQLQDDYLDVYGDVAEFGKNIGGDIVANKKTYMLIKALELADPETKEELWGWIERKEFDHEEKIKAVTRIYDRLGIKEIVFAAIDKYLKMSRDILDKIDVPKERKIDFYETLDAIGNRKK
ncbi:polyprenyl synthetase family protein [Butyricimonas virosa]|jgi:geranylgeranyl diphosphate synthase type II|uniref:Polyprenyl synthetase family protein n=2 Tax=Butyricimonas virosa TaxID=544645 RepID=A0A412WVQ9_9BACT|nr:polyprenyl synthetase family protein [Butyricimonas virosa]MDY4906331.1 polyprenyl synthetase family protein [Butyricimonas virosa]MDY5487869.1 polyprenyl synthetase family protein [Butyricimonas virosa]QRO50537.1 polyprenyl synthetase family protein [Butyricimonas virosa]RGV31457.1 polyprenyl synthetase family protein [Butyricimonas virosa]UWO48754.1 polyprenyl synthetase family protein [Butyricimonas virosa]